MNVLSTLGNSALVMCIGLLVVFFGLTLLIASIVILSTVLRRATAPKAEPAAPVAKVEEPAQPEAPAVEEGVDPQIVAVLTAAIMAMEGSNKKLVVRSVRRVGSSSAWAQAGRREQLIF